MRKSGLRLAAEHLADEDREGAAMWEHGLVQNLAGQSVAQFAADDGAIRVAAGIEAPGFIGLILGRCGLKHRLSPLVSTPTMSGLGGGRFTLPNSKQLQKT